MAESEVAEAELEVEDAAEEAESETAGEAEETADLPEEQPEDEEAAADTQSAEASEDESGESEDLPQLEGQPFSFRVDGQDFVVDGGFVYEVAADDGSVSQQVVMPREAFERHVTHLGHRGTWQREVLRLEQELQTKPSPDDHELVIEARTLLDGLKPVLQDPEGFQAWVEHFDSNSRLLQAEAKRAVAEAQTKHAESRVEAQHRAAQAEENDRLIVDKTPAAVQLVASELGVELPEDSVQSIVGEIYDQTNRVYFGLDDGGLGYDLNHWLAGRVALEHRALASAGTTPAQTKRAAAAKANRAVLSPKKPPTTAPAKESAAEPQKRAFSTAQEWRDDMGI